MRRNHVRKISIVLISLLLFLVFPSEVLASNVTNFTSKAIVNDSEVSPRMPNIITGGIGIQKNGNEMLIEFTTSAKITASVIGIKNIVIQEKVWYGWKTVYTSNGGESADRMLVGYTIHYTEAKEGTTYKVSCTHYANTGTYEEVENSKEYKF